jgi:Flp pilus assembly protein TadG
MKNSARDAGRRRRRGGNAVVEFAIGIGLLVTTFSGVYQFGYTFYVYDLLQSAVRQGARYGSLADYDGGLSGGAAFTNNVRNMVVYGTTAPASGALPVAPGLKNGNVIVTPLLDSQGVPSRITVQIDDFSINALFTTFTLSGKPKCSFDYTGRYTVP